LLGGLPEDAKEQIERRLMTEDGDFEELLVEADRLVDDYASDDISERDRLRFESHFLCTPERRRKLRFAATLREYLRVYWKTAPKGTGAAEKRGILTSFWDWLFKLVPHPTPTWGTVMAALVLAVATGVSSTVLYLRIQDHVGQLSAERGSLLQERVNLQQQLAAERARTEELTATVTAMREDPSPTLPSVASLVSFSLSPGLFREGGELARVRVPSDALLVALQLDIGLDEYPRYRAVLHQAEGDEVWAQARLVARTVSTGATVVLTLPSQLLTPGDYYVSLIGVGDDGATEGLGRYDFRVMRE
jgi:hypothetical protein